MKILKDHLVVLNQDQEAITPPCMLGQLLFLYMININSSYKNKKVNLKRKCGLITCRKIKETSLNVTRFAKTGHNSAFIKIHFIAPSCFGH